MGEVIGRSRVDPYGHTDAVKRDHQLLCLGRDYRQLLSSQYRRGRAGSDQELRAIITSQLRIRVSSATIIANYTLLLERMAQVGVGAGRA